MRYYSTNHQSPSVDFKEATVIGQPADRGLYFPETIPPVKIDNLSKEELALQIIKPYVGDAIPLNELERITAETINFDFPLVEVAEGMYALELFHGPTLAFKDVGARFMSRCLEYFTRNNNRKVIVLTATSGDTGGAVANGFYKAEGIDVVILYPSKRVSHVQELQLTTLGHNIHALEVTGSFDDCQRMVKQAFADNIPLMLTSANSINIARWLPQQFYYFLAWQQWPDKSTPPVFSVPSGNFGNLCAGLLAYRSGLPAAHFIAACNENDTVPKYFKTGQYKPQPSIPTLSNAMDVGDPSNFVRMLELPHNNITAYSISDDETRRTMNETRNYSLDPHGAVAYAALKKYGQKGIFLETAHPAKFNNEIPGSLNHLLQKKKAAIPMQPEYAALKHYLLSQFPK